MTAPKI